MSEEEFRKPIRKISEAELSEIIIDAAIQVYTEAGRPYGNHTSDLKRWFAEGGYEEECRRRQMGLAPERKN